MKKYILSVLLLTLLAAPALSYGAVDNSVTLAQLRAQILVLQRQIALLQSQQTQTCLYNKDLSYGQSGNDVVLLQNWLRASGFLNIPRSTGWFGTMTKLALSNWQRDNNLRVTGMLGLEDRLVLCGPNTNSPSTIIIDSISGPTSISAGLTGTWQVKVTAPANTNLNYSVDWGDGLVSPQTLGNSVFTHSYSRVGTYTVKFMVNNGIVCIAAPCTVRKTAEASMTVVVK